MVAQEAEYQQALQEGIDFLRETSDPTLVCLPRYAGVCKNELLQLVGQKQFPSIFKARNFFIFFIFLLFCSHLSFF
jgi:hypothetical protein